MLEINNLDEGKTDWINETQLIIPMVDNEEMQTKEIDGISKHTITLNALDGTDQTLLANANGQTLVIGLERTLFGNYTNKSDLLLMPNSDIKLLPSASDSKLTYNASVLDQTKTEIVWENNSFEKPLTKDLMNVIQDTSKGWSELGKNSDICLEDISTVNVHENKINADFLIEPHLINQAKKIRNDNSEYIVGYYPIEACDAVLVPTSLMTFSQKGVGGSVQSEKAIIIENDILDNTKSLNQIFINESIEDSQATKWMKSESALVSEETNAFITEKANNEEKVSVLKMTNTHENSLILNDENINKLNESVIPLIDSTNSDFMEAKLKNDIIYDEIGKCITKDDRFGEKVIENENTILPEQSLPLKKKAKMKKTPANGIVTFSSDDNSRTAESVFPSKKVLEEPDKRTFVQNQHDSNSDSDEPLSNQTKRKSEIVSYNFKKKKKESSENLRENNLETRKVEGVSDENNRMFKNITELLDQLKKEKYISDTIFKILQAGLQEMGVDVLKEMYNKRDNKSGEYSSHLKAFALMLHFKQPAAFNRLGEMFQTGWPSLATIKDWKRRLNNHRRPKLKSMNE